MINIPEGMTELPLTIETRAEPAYVMAVEDADPEDNEPWYIDILKYLKNTEYPPNLSAKEKRALCLQAIKDCICNDHLYKKGPDGLFLRCMGESETQGIMEMVNRGVCGTYMNGRVLASKISRLGYY